MTRPQAGLAPDTSVAICAYTEDRWDDLVRGVAGVRAQTAPPLELIVVIDHNERLLERAGELEGVRLLSNTRTPGASGARNCALDQARGSIVAFLDDDAAPSDADWLGRLVAPFEADDVVMTGGSARPWWPAERPAHLPHELDWIVGCTHAGQPRSQAPVRNVVACNMAMRRDLVGSIGNFNEDVGRIGILPMGCEETELCIRANQQLPGTRIVFVPDAEVTHRVSENRVEWDYLRSRSYAEGLSKAALAHVVGGGDATSDERQYLTSTIPAGLRRELGRAVRGDRSGLSAAAGIVTCVTATGVGYLRGLATQRLGSSSYAEQASSARKHGG